MLAASRKESSADGKASTDGAAGEISAGLKLWVVLARAQAAVARHAEADVARHGLTLAEFGILEALYHRGPLLLGDLQRKILVSSGGITYLVDRLEARGLLERQACPGDRRARFAALTSEGQAFVARIFPAHRDVILRALSGLSTAEAVRVTGLLKRLGTVAAALPISSGDR